MQPARSPALRQHRCARVTTTAGDDVDVDDNGVRIVNPEPTRVDDDADGRGDDGGTAMTTTVDDDDDDDDDDGRR